MAIVSKVISGNKLSIVEIFRKSISKIVLTFLNDDEKTRTINNR